MKLERIVVGVDFSDASRHATRWAAHVLAPGAEVVLAHVIDIPEPPGFLRDLSAPTDVLEATAREGAEHKLRQVSREANVQRSWIEVRRGTVAETLAAIADDYSAALIVLGSHRDGKGASNWLGTTGERVVGHARVPVLVAINPADSRPRHVLAAVDGSDISAEVDSWASWLAAKFGAAQTRLSVVNSAAAASLLASSPVTATSDDDVAKAGRDRWIARELGTAADPAPPEITFGEPAKEILAAASRFDSGLIVVGRRGAGRVRRAIFGSVTRDVLRGATCPVLVIRSMSDTS